MDHKLYFSKLLQFIVTPCYKVNVPETQPIDPILIHKSDLGGTTSGISISEMYIYQVFQILENYFVVLFWAPFSSRLLAWLEVAAKSGFPVRACPLCGDEKRHARVCWLGWPQLLFPACRVVKVTAAGAICVSAGLRSCAEALSCFPPDAIWAPEYCITCLAAGCSARHFMERQIARALNSDELSPFLPCGQQRRCREA